MIITGSMCEFLSPETLENLGVEIAELEEFASILYIFLGILLFVVGAILREGYTFAWYLALIIYAFNIIWNAHQLFAGTHHTL